MERKYILGRIGLYFWGEAEQFLGIWGAKANTFREKRKLVSRSWGDQCIIFRDLGSTYPPPLGALALSSSVRWLITEPQS